MSNKLRVFITIHHRNTLSLGPNRERLGYAAYHWGILIAPKGSTGPDCHAFDVTDGADPDPQARVDRNPDRNWFFRRKHVNWKSSAHLLGKAMIGKVPNSIKLPEIEERLHSVPLPQKDVIPEQNCVTWIISAIQQLQITELAEQFDTDEFMAHALEFADQRLKRPDATNDTINYTSRPM
jgi:hypothetical protein